MENQVADNLRDLLAAMTEEEKESLRMFKVSHDLRYYADIFEQLVAENAQLKFRVKQLEIVVRNISDNDDLYYDEEGLSRICDAAFPGGPDNE